jgi:hypothetical protein
MAGFQVFSNKDAIAFQEQISADLNYFNQSSTLLNQAIASIRGLVEVLSSRSRFWFGDRTSSNEALGLPAFSLLCAFGSA